VVLRVNQSERTARVFASGEKSRERLSTACCGDLEMAKVVLTSARDIALDKLVASDLNVRRSRQE